ncbi:hypothetical protein M404DRAFT_36398 [Pisolithus tinctorius Marx 270]|uniref:Uncharacterized protein n=1 Tax=Pisolithus tinctorius Marx 270 TaxID=870435 RepID=A0A0C3NB23_PISTI|nr:hypothetical protein M404DRAFT_36398 [Pisolithus tinctorius Marx 270]
MAQTINLVSPATIVTEKATWRRVVPFLARIKAKPWLYAVDIREDAEHEHACIEDKVEEVPDNPDDDEEVQAYEGTTEVAPENTESVEPNEFIDTLETYLEVDEEDEPVAYFGTMNPEDEPLEEEVVYCTSIRAEVQEGQMPSEDDALMQEDDPLIREDSPGNDAPRTENGSTRSMPNTLQSIMTPNDRIYPDAVVIETPWGMVWINRDGTVEHLTSSREEDNIVRSALLRINEDEMDLDPRQAEQPEITGGTWTWSPVYGATHSEYCPECQQRREHIDEAVAEENTSLTITLQFPAQLVFCEHNRGWEDCDRSQMEGHGPSKHSGYKHCVISNACAQLRQPGMIFLGSYMISSAQLSVA